MVGTLFDSNILIDHLLGFGAATEEIARHPLRALSIISWIEVMAGPSDRLDEVASKAFLANLRTIDLTPPIALRAAVIRRERRIKLPDAIVQATAETAGMLLVTRNEKDFPADLPGVRIPYRL